ncbi:uncharacterized protein LOC119746217 [Patiria miniata]|uniref:Uncharacterized protein n=1 Tax=Patiria miniata TaxID=46514 RepID=A0A914BTN0_PATMI|nr:uncharacterized protein LOC119746217 [Patiria miniata]XP_038078961.1 uncharacterized protein LOC119746217 [Patiria miniata]XP_038078962.1 uncharacterized protein LOC119746217 [Patiria miniata]
MDNMHLKPLAADHSEANGENYKPKHPQRNTRKTLCSTVKAFALDETTAHGFPNIFRAKTSLGRLLWTFLFLIGVGGTIYQGTTLVLKFLSYPVSVEVKIVTRPLLEFPSVTVCNTNKLRHSAIEQSKHRQMLVVDLATSLPYYAPCLEDDFACEKRPVCIKRYLLCDGIRQCGNDDLSDEQDCDYESRTCTDRQFRCGISGSRRGMCIPLRKKCDRRPDCYEGEDEDDCECKKSEFKCWKRGGCIAKKNVCNGKVDCFDGSDENTENCGDQNRPFPDCTSSWFFKCSNEAQCIPRIFCCDGFDDCLDSSDEPPWCDSISEDIGLVPYIPTCPSGQFMCTSDEECIPESWACDGSLDCKDGSDEAVALCGRPFCTPPQILCPAGGNCGTPCDLNPECLNGWDETNCTCQVLDEETVVEDIHCRGVSSATYFVGAEYLYLTSCLAITPVYHCDGGLECFNPTTKLPDHCKTVYSECYIATNGWDYRGTQTEDDCLPWSDPRVALLNYTGQNFRELEGVKPGSTVGHSLCRNPGGERDTIWCFVDSRNGSLEYKDCVLPPKPAARVSCHHESFSVALSQDDESADPTQGRVEVSFRTGAVGTISDPDWTLEDANVVCRQLGFPAGAIVNSTSDFGPGTGRVLLRDVQCMGIEVNLIDCMYRLATDQDTNHTYDVGVVCNDTDAALRRRRRDVDPAAEPVTDRPTPACQLDEFQCTEGEPDGTIQCIPREYVCDRYNDCGNDKGLLKPGMPMDSDEQHCNLSVGDCGHGNFKCRSGECIRYWQTCNEFPDCQDGSDELLLECEISWTACQPKEWQCLEPRPDGTVSCIPGSFRCDRYNDCGDNKGPLTATLTRASDERTCHKPGEVPPDNYYHCRDSFKFIHEYAVCNTVEDCKHGDDEQNCSSAGRADPFRDAFQDPQWYFPYRPMVDNEHRYLFDDFIEHFRAPPFGRVKGDNPPDWNGFATFSSTPDYSDLVGVARLSKDEVSRYGHQKEDFILQCTYEQRKCNMSNVELLQDDNYGNCFTFNAVIDNPITSQKTGSRYGLQMTLFLEQNEYISIYGPEAGVRVSINPNHIRPNPAENGITVKPGTVTSLGLRYNYVLRKGHPYGECLKNVTNTKIIADGEIKISSSDHYDRELCKKTCIHEYIRKYCGCSDTLELNGERCSLLNKTQEVCTQLVYYLSQHNNLTCSCPQQCSEVYYTKTSSMSKWPSQKFADHLLRNIRSINKKTQHLNEDNLFDNIVRLEIYYEELNYESTKEVAAYQEASLFGDIGGIVGLYIGFSLITVCEFIALFLKLINKFCFKRTVKI